MQDKEYNVFICGNRVYVYKELKYINSKLLKENCQWIRFIERNGIRMVEYVKAKPDLSIKITDAIICWCQDRQDILTVVNMIYKSL